MGNKARKTQPAHGDIAPTWKATLLGLTIVLVGFAVIAFALPLKTAFLLGEDEGFEVIKPMLCNQGYSLYTGIWNDQPPLYTVILAKAFKLFGMSIFTARCVTVFFAVVLLTSFYLLVCSYSAVTAAVISCFLLITAPSFLVLSVSAMLELPAFALGIVALWFMRVWSLSQHSIWVILSGAAMALACSIKLTAVLLGPAILLLPWLNSKSLTKDAKPLTKTSAFWGIGFFVFAGLIGLTWGKGSLESSWRSHTKAQTVEHLKMPADQKFNFQLLGDHAESIIAACVSVVIALRYRRFREILISSIFLATVTIVHSFHRPWWNYYYLHFAIPVVWMAGWVINVLLQQLIRFCSETKIKWNTATVLKTVGLCLLFAAPLARAERRLEGYFKDLNNRQLIKNNPIIEALHKEPRPTDWIYAESGIYPFHVNLPVNPALAIIMPKRFWSGQISTDAIIALLEEERPKLIVLQSESLTIKWSNFLQKNYTYYTHDEKCTLYRLKL